MADPIKIIGAEIALTTANTVANASLVRVVNTHATEDAVITIKNSNGDTLGSFTLGSAPADYSNEAVVKQPTDTLAAAGGTVKAAPMAYR